MNSFRKDCQRKTVLLLFGGKSPEHEVSVISAQSILEALDDVFVVVPWYIQRNGSFAGRAETQAALPRGLQNRVPVDFPYEKGFFSDSLKQCIDIVFPLLHGPNGEDGVIQGVCEFLDLPYVGNGILASSLTMDKVMSKAIFENAGLPVLPYVSFQEHNWQNTQEQCLRNIEECATYPYFIKPANLGSSIGITQAKDRQTLIQAIETAFRYDKKVLIEQGIQARELEIGLLGNTEIELSIIGEIETDSDFYDYHAKYHAQGTRLIIPATLSPTITQAVNSIAKKAFQACDLSGLARIDFLLEKSSNTLYLNEINTIPGFTKGSMYPKLWLANHRTYPMLIRKLLDLACARYKTQRSHVGLLPSSIEELGA